MMDRNEKLGMLAQLLMLWQLGENKRSPRIIESEEDELIDGSFVPKILVKRMKVYGIPIQLPLELLAILEIGLNSNPGYSLVCLYEIIKAIPDLKPQHIITANDFVRVFPDYFPDIDDPKIFKRLEEMWDNQKTPDRLNKVDSRAYWMELFK